MRTIQLIGPRGARWRCDLPTTRRERVSGLLGRTPGSGEALLLDRCTSVHTFGMAEAITVARLSSAFEVRDVRVLPPRRLLTPTWRRGHVLECNKDDDVRVGDRLLLEELEPLRRGNRRGRRPR